MRFQNGFDKVVIELLVVQFWSEIILVVSNRTHAARSFDFEITRMISDQIALHSVQLPLFILCFSPKSYKQRVCHSHSIANSIQTDHLSKKPLGTSPIAGLNCQRGGRPQRVGRRVGKS